jgi:flagellar biosynthetic protein FlhB
MATEERTEQPTERKRRRAREKGQVATSVDLSRALGLLLIYLAWRVAGRSITGRLLAVLHATFCSPRATELEPDQIMAAYRHLLPVLAAILGPIMLAALLGVVLPSLGQTRLLFAPTALRFDWNHINPLAGFRRLVSWRGAVATLKGIIKVAVVLGVCAWVLRARAGLIVGMGAMDLGPMTAAMLAIAGEMVVKSCIILVLLGAADYAYERYEHEKSLRMTRQELRREMRETEGDPQVQARRRQLRRGLLEQGISAEMPRASVVVTNPTHVAVALRYDPDEMPAPKLVAKGQRAIARRIIALARTYGVPVLHNPPVARSIFEQVAIGSPVPETLYRVVAEIFAIVYRRRRERLLRRRRLVEGFVTGAGEDRAP